MNIKRWVPAPLVPPLRICRNYVRHAFEGPRAYEARIQKELETFSAIETVYDLPPIAHYWSNKHLVPLVEPLGFTNSMELFRTYMSRICREKPSEVFWFLSVGAGDSAPEINLAEWLLENDIRNFAFECLDLNAEVLSRGERSAHEKGLLDKFTFTNFDVKVWRPHRQYSIILAIQALHHFLELEVLFDRIEQSLHPDGYFLTDDMIGRNGHQRWPEALKLLDEIWKDLPKKYTFNNILKRYEKKYENWDCSAEGFEGIRAEDIMPLLIKRFHFELFLGFGNLIDPFIDRGFGPNFDPENEWDREFIDRVHRIDMDELESGRLKPTHIYAAMTKKPVTGPKIHKAMTPESCIRWPEPKAKSIWKKFR